MTNGDDVRYAGFWRRVVATVIDGLLILVVTAPVLVSIYGIDYYVAPNSLVEGFADFLVSWVLPAVAVILFWICKQATPGKMAMSVKIVDARSGGKASAGRCVGRYFAYIPSALVLGIGFLWVAFDGRKQGWHDKIAGTLVIRTKPEAEVGTGRGDDDPL